MLRDRFLVGGVACTLLLLGRPSLAAPVPGKGSLRAGAALLKSGYAARTEGYKGFPDRLYVRAIEVDGGANQIAIVPDSVAGEPKCVAGHDRSTLTNFGGIVE